MELSFVVPAVPENPIKSNVGFSLSSDHRTGRVTLLSFLSNRRPSWFRPPASFFLSSIMKTLSKDGVTTVVDQAQVVIPDLTVKDLLSAIP